MGQAAVAWIRNTAEEPERRPTDIGWLDRRRDRRGGGRRLGPEPVGDRRQLLHPAERAHRHRRCLQGGLRARLDLGARGGRARAPRVPPGRRGVAGSRSPAHSPGASPSSSTRSFPRTRSRDQRQRADRRRPGVPDDERRDHHRARGRSSRPYAVRPLRRILFLVILLVAVAAMYLGAGYPSDALGGLLLGIAAGAAVLVVFGSPAGRPTIDEVRARR